MADSLLARQAATYKSKTTQQQPAQQRPPAPALRPMSQRERQALTYGPRPKDAAAFKQFSQGAGLSEEQARQAINWLVAEDAAASKRFPSAVGLSEEQARKVVDWLSDEKGTQR